MSENSLIYMDNAATTKVDPEVLAAMQQYFCEAYGNAASKYNMLGRTALQAVEEARAKTAALIGATADELFLTSGATESINWIFHSLLLASDKKHVITSSIEHHAVLETIDYLEKTIGVESTILDVDEHGLVDPAAVRAAMRDDTALVSIMHANNEIGTLEPIAEISNIVKEKGALFHTDACQTVGKILVDVNELGVDFLTLSAHKFHGPKGIGALYVRKGIKLPAFIHGGGQEKGKRAGTTNVPGAVGMGKAAELAVERMEAEGKRQSELVEKMWAGLSEKITKIHRNGHPEKRIPNVLNVCVEGAEGEAILGYLDMYGIVVSSGSACATGSLDPSHVLLAIGLPVELAHGSIRFSLGSDTTGEDVDKILEIMPQVVQRLRDMSVTWNG